MGTGTGEFTIGADPLSSDRGLGKNVAPSYWVLAAVLVALVIVVLRGRFK